MDNINNTLAQLYKKIEGQVTNPKELESLRRVKQACDYLLKSGLKVTYPAVERYCLDREFPGPKAQSIRNSRHVLKVYVDACAGNQDIPRTKEGVLIGPVIRDESIRAYVKLVEQERDMAVESLRRVEKGLRTVPGISIDKILATGLLEQGQADVPGPAVANIKKAIRNLLESARLKDCGLELAKGRLLHTTTRNVLLEKSDVEALHTYLSESSQGADTL